MKSKLRTVAVAVVSLVSVVALAACGSGAPAGRAGKPAAKAAGSAAQPATATKGVVTVSFANWASAEPATRPQIDKVISRFEQQNPGIHIKSIPISFTNILHQLILQTTAGNPPDVAQISGNDTMALAATGALQPLGGIAPASFLKTLYPSEVALGRYKGHLDALPWIVAPLALWYNKTLMKQAGLDPNRPPATMSEWLHDMQVIKAKEPKVLPFGLDATNRSFGLDVNWPLMLSFGAHPLGTTAARADTPQMANYLQFVRTLADQGYTLRGKLLGEFRPLAAENKMAFAFDGPYLQGVILSLNKSLTPKQFYATWGVTVLPSGPGGPRHYTIPTDHQLVMFKAAKDKAAAWKFMQYLISSKTAITDYTLASGTLPPLSNAVGVFPQQMDTPIMKAYVDKVIPTVVRPGWGPLYSKAYPIIMTGVQQAMSSSQPLASIDQSIQGQLQPLYKK